MKSIVLFCVIILKVSLCNGSYIPCFQKSGIDTIMENRVYQKVSSLIEVKTYSNYIDSISKGEKGVTIITKTKPQNDKKYYWVQVGVNDGFRFTPNYNFYVYPDGMIVKFYDTINDKILNLDEWRKHTK